MSKYYVVSRESGDMIESVDSYADGIKLIQEYEETAKKDGIFEDGLYELRDEDGETVYFNNNDMVIEKHFGIKGDK